MKLILPSASLALAAIWVLGFASNPASAQVVISPAVQAQVQARAVAELPNLLELYRHLHIHPELSFHEVETSKRIAAELRHAGFETTENVGGHGVVGVLRNGAGPTILLRTDLDALPVHEQTGLPYSSQAKGKDDQGNEVDVMHACGHDIHMTVFVGTARTLANLSDQWHGTVVMVGQPAEERVGGAKAMLADGLFTRFPKPDYCLAFHAASDLPAGTVGYIEGFALANVDSVDIVVRGVGGHGAWPHLTKDPVVLAAEIVVALQTIVSRETAPTDPAVVTVGSIHGGTKYNIIPDEVRLQLTIRSYSDEVQTHTIAAIRRIAKGLGEAAGVPPDKLPLVTVADESAKATYNDPALTRRAVEIMQVWLGSENLIARKPVMGAEDFGLFGRTEPRIPISLLWLGSVTAESVKESLRTGKTLPSLHSAFYAPVPEPTIKTGVIALTGAVMELTAKK